MDCHIDEVYPDGSRKRVESSPNGHPDHVYPSRGWAQSSAMQHADSWAAVIERGDADPSDVPDKLVVVGEEDGNDYQVIKVSRGF
jgi:hypothetical protein